MFTVLHPRAQHSPWPERGETKHARLPLRDSGPISTAPGSLISRSRPVLRPPPIHTGVFVALCRRACYFVSFRRSLCLSWTASSGSVGRRRCLICAHSFSAAASSITVASFLLCLRPAPRTDCRTTAILAAASLASQRCTSPGRCTCLLTSGLLSHLYLPIC